MFYRAKVQQHDQATLNLHSQLDIFHKTNIKDLIHVVSHQSITHSVCFTIQTSASSTCLYNQFPQHGQFPFDG